MEPRTLLDRWFGRAAPSPELATALADLDRLGVARAELTGAATTLGGLLLAAFADSEAGPLSTAAQAAMEAAWSRGQPSYQAHPPRLDRAKLTSRLRRIVALVDPSGDFTRVIDARGFDLMVWADAVLAGRPEELTRDAERRGINPDLAASGLRLTLLPSLATVSAVLDRARPEGVWDRGDCPNCGSRPLLAESRGLEQRIFYRCGLCAGDWPGERLRCPSCDEADPKVLHHSFVEGEQDRCRLAHCDACRYDWKVVSTLTALTPPAMIVADLATVHLDLLAADLRDGSP